MERGSDIATRVSRGGVSAALFFFFQAEDGIRDYKVTGVQTCALPISIIAKFCPADHLCVGTYGMSETATCVTSTRATDPVAVRRGSNGRPLTGVVQIGRASCRERV